jgi:hypothetical protein
MPEAPATADGCGSPRWNKITHMAIAAASNAADATGLRSLRLRRSLLDMDSIVRVFLAVHLRPECEFS